MCDFGFVRNPEKSAIYNLNLLHRSNFFKDKPSILVGGEKSKYGNQNFNEKKDMSVIPDKALEINERNKILSDSMEEILTNKQIQILHMQYYKEMSMVEIAAETKVSLGTVKSGIYDAKGKLKKHLEKFKNAGLL